MAVQKERQPRYSVNEDILVLGGMLGLLTEHSTRMHDRFEEDFVPECEMVLEDLRNADGGQEIRRKQQTSSTGKFREHFDEGVARLGGLHAAVRRLYKNDKSVADAFGLKVHKNGKWSYSELLAGLDLAINAATDHPEIAAAVKIRQRDIDALKAVRANLISAASNKQNKINDRRAGTATKISIQLDVERRIDEILAAAKLEFATEPAILERYISLIPTKRTRTKKEAAA